MFLSHAVRDRMFVQRIARVLAKHGIKTWHSEHGIRGGEQWHDEIGEALKRCKCMIVVLSQSSVRSRWVRREVLYAIQHNRHIIPIIIEDCDPEKLSWTLLENQMIIFTKRFAKACRELLRIWGIEYRA